MPIRTVQPGATQLERQRLVILDAHHHLWTLKRSDYGWLKPDLTALYRDFLPGDLDPLLAAAGVVGTVIVQAAPSEEETCFLLDLAAGWSMARAVVGWTDMTSAAASRRLEQLADEPLLRGIRPMIQDEPDPDWMLRSSVGVAFRAIGACGLTFDALVRADQLPALARLVDRHPDTPVVIDHGAKPAIAAGGFQPWAEDIRALSRRPQVMCKLSGLLTEAGSRNSDTNLSPYVEHLLLCFGPERLMWGSDWPVLTQAGDYGRWLAQARRLLRGIGEDARSWIFGRTAARFYGIEDIP